MTEAIKILFVDDEPNVLKSLKRLFIDEDYEIFSANSGEEGLALLEEQWDTQIVISDYRMPGMNGVDFLKKVYGGWPDSIRIVLSGFADTASVVAAINEGQIYKFVGKPWDDEDLKSTVSKAVEHYHLKRKNQDLTRQLMNSNYELKQLNEDLEKAVTDRNAELIFQNGLLQQGQNILDVLPVGVVGLDSSGFVAQSNQMFYKITGQEAGSAMGQDASEILPDEIIRFISEIGTDKVKGQEFNISERPCRIKGVRMKIDDKEEGVVLVIDPEDG